MLWPAETTFLRWLVRPHLFSMPFSQRSLSVDFMSLACRYALPPPLASFCVLSSLAYKDPQLGHWPQSCLILEVPLCPTACRTHGHFICLPSAGSCSCSALYFVGDWKGFRLPIKPDLGSLTANSVFSGQTEFRIQKMPWLSL